MFRYMTTLLSCSINNIISLLEFSISISTIVHRVVGLYTPVNEGSAKIINLISRKVARDLSFAQVSAHVIMILVLISVMNMISFYNELVYYIFCCI